MSNTTETSRFASRPGTGPWSNHDGFTQPWQTESLSVACRVPTAVLHAAAQFVSGDETKQAITAIDVRKDGEFIRVSATDGHCLFITRVPLTTLGVECAEGVLRVDAKAFKGAVKRGEEWTCLFSDGVASVGALPGDETKDVRCWLPFGGQSIEFPNVDQLMPDYFSNAPGVCVGFNPAYLAKVMKLAAKFTGNGLVTLDTNTPNTPTVWTYEVEQKWVGGNLIKSGFTKEWDCEPLTCRVLVMPKLIRR